ncbi:hypothetical protein DSCA_52410 [Desulfosarcina alkanivorans]|uniref:histidine kinase n=1 Tax=Desulfosarcina alkanivorans TaxID=571177 RepID=A0A5K7YW56_9BACT|nr:ATP-binding protein [Desulfosarcina alkanivorans]BBO71311.1 hypothetical protein DSCA_52410 [Desulfosarcina alkanivorans]
MSRYNNRFIHPRYTLFIGLILFILMAVSAYFEFRQRRLELMQMHKYEGLALLETIKQSIANSIASQSESKEQIAERLFNNARLLREIEIHQPLTHSRLKDIAARNNLYRINVFNSKGDKVASNVKHDTHNARERHRPSAFFQPILDGKVQEIDIGLKQARHYKGKRYAVAVKRHHGGVIVVNINAAEMLSFNKRIGIAKLFADIGGRGELKYIVLQDEDGIIAATPGVGEMASMEADDFFSADSVQSRIARFNDQEALEVISPFGIQGSPTGILRIGLHLDEIRALEKRMLQRAVIISIGIILIGFISISAVVISQNYAFLKQEHALIQTYTGNILHAMSDAVFGVDAQQSIKFANRAALHMLHLDQNQVTGHRYADFFGDCQSIVTALEQKQKIENAEQKMQIKALNRLIFVSASVSFVMGETGEIDTGVILLRDQTKQKQLEEQIHRQEKLTAMGEFASGVAHEIRNPLNAISMIVQRFQKEFEPKTDADEYFDLTRTVRSEIDRIGNIIRQFLEFARPAKLNKRPIAVDEMIMQSINVVRAQAEAQHIRIAAGVDAQAVINVDKNQFHQALLNLLQNAIEAVGMGGTISISAMHIDQHIRIRVQDDGAGIPQEQQKRIFDLNFTSKPTGMGLGLALVHRMVTEHGGDIAVQSKPGEGTTFTLILPIEDPQSSRRRDEPSDHR